jgi:acetylornithine deacetylase/succinyl-diaminopimelate desuccinylase-like protein
MSTPVTVALSLAIATGLFAPAANAATDNTAAAHTLLGELVAIDTSLGKNGVTRAAELVAARLRAGGFEDRDITLVPTGDTAALVVRYRGRGERPPMDLMAHLDVVAAHAEDWGRDPFTLIEDHGYLIGRGTLDVKGEIALLVTTLIGLRQDHFVPDRDLILVLTGDEETGGASGEALIAQHRELVEAEFALNADNLGGGMLDEKDGHPVLFRVQGAEKTAARLELRTRNAGGHSSQPRDDNAIYALAAALNAVQHNRFPVRYNEWTLGDLAGTGAALGGELGTAMLRFAADPADEAAAERISREPTFVGRLRTTCVATQLSGGHALNALPQSASALLSCRIFPGDTLQDVHDHLQQWVGPDVEVIDGWPITQPPPSPLRADVMAAVQTAIAATHPGARVIPTQSSYATDGSTFRLGGIPTYGVGGLFIRDSEQFAHGLNERIPVASFDAGLTYWRVLIETLAGSPAAH